MKNSVTTAEGCLLSRAKPHLPKVVQWYKMLRIEIGVCVYVGKNPVAVMDCRGGDSYLNNTQWVCAILNHWGDLLWWRSCFWGIPRKGRMRVKERRWYAWSINGEKRYLARWVYISKIRRSGRRCEAQMTYIEAMRMHSIMTKPTIKMTAPKNPSRSLKSSKVLSSVS